VQVCSAAWFNNEIEIALALFHTPPMNFMKLAGCLLFAASLFAGCNGCKKPVQAPPIAALQVDPVYGHLLQAQARLPTIKVWLGDQELIAEIAREQVQIATGMMFRTNMPENEAMLFVFPNADSRSFYMRNCTVPLSAAYIDPNGRILEIIKLQPHDETGVGSVSSNVQFVLEVPQGWFQRHNVSTGAVVRTERGTLMDISFPRR
jgi:uncharacterized membrane protein (UPF0127 family)